MSPSPSNSPDVLQIDHRPKVSDVVLFLVIGTGLILAGRWIPHPGLVTSMRWAGIAVIAFILLSFLVVPRFIFDPERKMMTRILFVCGLAFKSRYPFDTFRKVVVEKETRWSRMGTSQTSHTSRYNRSVIFRVKLETVYKTLVLKELGESVLSGAREEAVEVGTRVSELTGVPFEEIETKHGPRFMFR